MANFGIGLGAFVQGFANGMEMRQRSEDRKLRLEQAKEDRAYTQERRARQSVLDAQSDQDRAIRLVQNDEDRTYTQDRRKRQQVLDSRSDEEYSRNETQRKNIQQIGLGAVSDFNKDVSEGKAKAGDFDTYWSKNVVPKLTQTYLASGDMEGAKKAQEWADSADAKKGGKLALQSMLLAQQGDMAGALEAAQQAGQVQGYINHGYEIGSQTQIVDNKGRLQGYRLNLKTQDGKSIVQDVPLKDVPTLLGRYLNPQAAFASQQATAAADAKDKRELKNYSDKKVIDQQMGGADKIRSEAIKSLRKRMDGGLTGENPKFDDLPGEEQERAIQKEIELQKGVGLGINQTVAPLDGSVSRKALMDTATGQRLPMKPVAPPSSQAMPKPSTDTVSQEQRVQSVLQDSANALSAGENPDRIKQNLLNNGVPEQIWPAALRAKLEQSQSGVFGLGR